jgi:hypothetical protein
MNITQTQIKLFSPAAGGIFNTQSLNLLINSYWGGKKMFCVALLYMAICGNVAPTLNENLLQDTFQYVLTSKKGSPEGMTV